MKFSPPSLDSRFDIQSSHNALIKLVAYLRTRPLPKYCILFTKVSTCCSSTLSICLILPPLGPSKTPENLFSSAVLSLLMVCFLPSSSSKYNAQPLVLAHVHSRYSCTYCSCYQKLLENFTHPPTTLNGYAKARVNIPCTKKSTVAQRL